MDKESPLLNCDTVIAIDIGNSRIACAVFLNGALIKTFYFPTTACKMAATRIIDDYPKAHITLCSVVPAASKELIALLQQHHAIIHEVSPNQQNIIKGTYTTLGADRLANILAGWKLYGDSIILDFGTATTLTAVSGNGTFAGGFITLGLGKTIALLHASAAQLPAVTLGQNLSRTLAFDTESSIINGTVLGHLGLIEHWIKIARKQLGSSAQVIATGGWCELITRQSHAIDLADPLLTLKGAYISYSLARDLAGQG